MEVKPDESKESTSSWLLYAIYIYTHTHIYIYIYIYVHIYIYIWAPPPSARAVLTCGGAHASRAHARVRPARAARPFLHLSGVPGSARPRCAPRGGALTCLWVRPPRCLGRRPPCAPRGGTPPDRENPRTKNKKNGFQENRCFLCNCRKIQPFASIFCDSCANLRGLKFAQLSQQMEANG